MCNTKVMSADRSCYSLMKENRSTIPTDSYTWVLSSPKQSFLDWPETHFICSRVTTRVIFHAVSPSESHHFVHTALIVLMFSFFILVLYHPLVVS